jgi:lysophospholipase L1-like esterase
VLLVSSLGILIASLVLPIRPLSALLNILVRHGWREFLLAILSIAVTTITVDLLLKSILPPNYVAESKYGWQPRADHVELSTVEDTTGRFREVTRRYFHNGFKRWGNPDTHHRKILVLGDSFTEAAQVSNGEEWYSYLERQLSNIELFVYGGGGYGSLQEYLVLDDFVDRIKPNLVLWQFCTNDYSNNLYEYDVSIYPYNNHGVRPYLEEGRIVYRLPLPYAKLREYSFFADRLLKRYDEYAYRRATRDLATYKRSREEQDTKEVIERRRTLRAKGRVVTLEIMKKVRARANGIPMYAFNPCGGSSEDEEKMFSEAGIVFIPGIAEYVHEKGVGREVQVPNDGHWNKLGNQLAGEKLVQTIQEKEVLKEQWPRNH